MNWRKFLCGIGLTVFALQSFSQSSNSANYQEDTAKVNKLLAESKAFYVNDPDKVIRLNNEAMQIAEKAEFEQGIAYALKNIGVAYYFKSKYVEALQYYNQSLDRFKAMKDNVGIANLLSNIGVIYYDKGDDAKALEHYLQSLRYAELANNKLRILTALNNVGGVYNNKAQTYDKALEYYLKALPICEEVGDKQSLGSIAVNVGNIYFNKNQNDKALSYFNKALKAYGTSEGSLNAYKAIGDLYLKDKKYDLALFNKRKAMEIAEKLDGKLSLMQTVAGMGDVYYQMNDHQAALNYYIRAEKLGVEIEANTELRDLYKKMALAYAKDADYASAFKYQTLFSEKSAAVYNADLDKKMATLQFGYDLDKKQTEIDLLTKDKSIQDLQIKRQRTFRNALIVGLGLVVLIVLVLFRDYRVKIKTNKLLDKQKAQIENLLLNILPTEVAHELKTTGEATPRNYASSSILFTDFKNFTSLSEKMTPNEVVKELNTCFMAFDDIIEAHNLEKIKTIGDAYMCAGGLPTPDDQHVFNMVKASLEMQEFIRQNNLRRVERGLPAWEIRIGINVGPVIAGVVGKKKYAYDIWGSAVNIASRMESNGMPGQINISSSVYEIIKGKYACIYRGKINAKNVGEIDMYFIDHEIESANGFKSFEEVTKPASVSSNIPVNVFE